MTTSVRGGQLARLLGQWHVAAGPAPQPGLRRAGRRDPRPARRRPAAAGRPAARRAGAGRGAGHQPDHRHRRVPRAARHRPPDQPARRRQLDHPAGRPPGGQLRAVDAARRPRHDRPGLRRAGRADRAGRRPPGPRPTTCRATSAAPATTRPGSSSCARRSPPATPPRAADRGRPDPDHQRHAARPRPGAAAAPCRPARAVLVESPTYPNALAALAARRARISTHGLDAADRLGRRAAARRAAADPAAAGVRDPGVPEPDRSPDAGRAARAAGRRGARAPAPTWSSTSPSWTCRWTARRCRRRSRCSTGTRGWSRSAG